MQQSCIKLAAFVLIFSGQILLAQVTTGAILGVIRDDTGAVLTGVSVAVHNTNTGIARVVVTDDKGRYHAPNLALGNYEVRAELQGFQTGVRSGIQLTLEREAVVDLTLKVGAVEEKLTVTGEAPLVETTTSSLSGLVDDQKIRDLPSMGAASINWPLSNHWSPP